MPQTLTLSPGATDWASGHGIQGIPYAPLPAGGTPQLAQVPPGLAGGIPIAANNWQNPWGFQGVPMGSLPGSNSNAPLLGSNPMGGGGSPSSFPDTNYTGQFNPNPQPAPGPNFDWGKLFGNAPLWSQPGSGGGLDHNSLADIINQLMGGKLFGGSGGAWGTNAGGAWR